MCAPDTYPGRHNVCAPLLLLLLGACFVLGGSTNEAHANVNRWLDRAPARWGCWVNQATRSVRRFLDQEQRAVHKPVRSATEVFAETQHGPFDDLILSAARRWKLDPFLFKGLLANESKLDPVRYGKRRFGRKGNKRVVISGGAIGIAQFTGGGIRAINALRRRRERRGEPVLYFDHDRALQPHEAIPAAAELLAHLVGRYGRDGGVTAYNSGVVGGLAVARYGFWRARHEGRLRRVGIYLVQGERFLLKVLRNANNYRKGAGLALLPEPDAERPASRRYAGLPARPLLTASLDPPAPKDRRLRGDTSF